MQRPKNKASLTWGQRLFLLLHGAHLLHALHGLLGLHSFHATHSHLCRFVVVPVVMVENRDGDLKFEKILCTAHTELTRGLPENLK